MRASFLLIVAGSLVLATPACRQRGTATLEPGAVDTAVAETVQARLTSEAPTRTLPPRATDTPVPEPTEILVPTDTPPGEPTVTPDPTDTSVPPTAPATETSTPVPTSAPPTATSTLVPTPAESPTDKPTQTPTISPTPACSLEIALPFKSRLEAHGDILLELGCPIEPARETWAAEQRFQLGGMLWQQDSDLMHIVYGNGMYQVVPDQWEEGDAEYSCPGEGPPPAGLVMPMRGFGWHWCNTPGVQAGLGWALEEEKGYQAMWQNFEGGHVLPNRQDMLFAFYDDGTWVSVE